jgi:hypothetical protein
VIIKATVDMPRGRFQGVAYEEFGSNFINETSAVENCQTSAVGRALAFAGYGTDAAIASAEEVAHAMIQRGQEQEAESDPPEPEDYDLSFPPEDEPETDQATDKQLALIHSTVLSRKNQDIITDAERQRVKHLLEMGMTRSKATEVLDYFLGKSAQVEGRWKRVTEGEIEKRRKQKKAA